MSDPLKPSPQLLIKIGSIIVHYQEMTSSNGHAFDKIALDALLKDASIIEWLEEMDKNAFLPKKRK